MTSEHNIDVKAEGKDRETITVLVLNHVEERYRLFIMKYILGQMWNLLGEGKIPIRNMINIREASEFFRVSEKSIVEERFKIFKVILSDYIRYGRGKMHFNLDAQSPSEVAGLVEGSQDMTFLGKMPGEDDRKIATDQLRRDGKITSKQITDLGELEPGEFYIIEAGKVAKKRYLFLPRTLFWKEGYGNFDKIWKKYHGNSFKNIKELKNLIEEEYQKQKKEYKEKEREKEEKHQEEMKNKKEQEEERRIREKLEREKKYLIERNKMKKDLKKQEKKEVTIIQNENSYQEITPKKNTKEEELNNEETTLLKW